MSFLIYFFVLLVSAASVLFGLDLMNSPLPKTPNVPIGRSVQVVSPPPAQERQKRVADERALTPVYPTEPGKPKIQAETSGAAPQEQQQASLTPPPATPAPVATPAPATTVAPAPQPQPVAQAPQPAPEVKTEQAKAEPVAPAQPAPAPVVEAKTEPAVTAQPVTQQTANTCNVQACGAAYQSFRASDCTYQPSAGPRRACTMTRGATTASAPKPRRAAREAIGKDELRDVERIVKRQPLQLTPSARRSASNSEISEVERIVRHMTRNESGDVAVQDGDGNIIVVRKSYR